MQMVVDRRSEPSRGPRDRHAVDCKVNRAALTSGKYELFVIGVQLQHALM